MDEGRETRLEARSVAVGCGKRILAAMIGVIDYGMGNLRSVQKAFERVGARVSVLSEPDQIKGVDRLVLPGVGAFADGMSHLEERGWVGPIRGFIDSGSPFLGICLGMQLLFDGSQEDADGPESLVSGMSILPGRVVRFEPTVGPDSKRRLKVPHMGWNAVRWERNDPLFHGLDQGCAVYFVHGYYVEPTGTGGGPDIASGWATYGQRFCASVWHKNIWATQYHPEKSQKIGLQMLANFSSR